MIWFFSGLCISLWQNISHVKVLERSDGEYCDHTTSLNNQSIEHPIRTTVNYSRVIFPCFGYGIHVLLKIADNALLIFCKMSFFLSKNKKTVCWHWVNIHKIFFLLIQLVKITPPQKKSRKTPFFTVGTDWYHKILNSGWTSYVTEDARVI